MSVNHCCGNDRNTPFCPICGQRLSINNAAGLLAYVSSCAEDHRRTKKNNQDQLQSEQLDKWESWEAALQDLMKNQANRKEMQRKKEWP